MAEGIRVPYVLEMVILNNHHIAAKDFVSESTRSFLKDRIDDELHLTAMDLNRTYLLQRQKQL